MAHSLATEYGSMTNVDSNSFTQREQAGRYINMPIVKERSRTTRKTQIFCSFREQDQFHDTSHKYVPFLSAPWKGHLKHNNINNNFNLCTYVYLSTVGQKDSTLVKVL